MSPRKPSMSSLQVENLEKLSMTELTQLEENIAKAKDVISQRDGKEALEKLRKHAKSMGFSLEALMQLSGSGTVPAETASKPAQKASRPAASTSTAEKAKPSTAAKDETTDKRKLVLPKYRNPENALETWTGRGIKPKWVQQYLEKGGNLEKIQIPEEDSLAIALAKKDKYINPEDPTQSWSGRGAKPKWVKDYLAAGGNINGLKNPNQKTKSVPGAPKYRNPDNASETWTGQGRKPGWIIDFIESGGDLETIMIEKEADMA